MTDLQDALAAKVEEWREWANKAGSAPYGPIGKADGVSKCADDLEELLQEHQE